MSIPEAEDTTVYFNGVDVVRGEYGLSPISGPSLAEKVRGEAAPENLVDLKARRQRDAGGPEAIAALNRELAAAEAELAAATDAARAAVLLQAVERLRSKLASLQHLGVKEGIDATDLAQAGWGVIFAADADPELKAALAPLLRRRAAQAGARYREFEREKGHRGAKDSKTRFVERNGGPRSGPADPDRIPYYLLIVGGPAAIPYSFQYQLDVQYAVGRLHFDTLDEYANYAQNVVAAETRGNPRPRRLDFFAVENPDDRATRLSATMLVDPLRAALARDNGERGWGWTIDANRRADTRRAALARLLGGGPDTPALLFTASHGVELPPDHPRLSAHQGALLCSDWPGPLGPRGPVPEEFYLAGEHLDRSADLTGLMVFAFACYAAGTPEFDEFSRLGRVGAPPSRRAPAPFVSGLARSLLGRPRGALAMIGHVDRAWGCSFVHSTPGGGTLDNTEMFRSALARLLNGSPVGHAFEYFNERHAEVATVLVDQLDQSDRGQVVEWQALVRLWLENNDARNYVVLGDPAVRLRFTADPSLAAPVLEPGARSSPGSPVSERPAGISEADWLATPAAVRELLVRMRAQLDGH